jgi:hypothetical protein
MRHGSISVDLPGQDRRVLARHLEGDVRPRMARADHEDRALAQLRRIAVVAGVQLRDRRIQVTGEVGHDRRLERAGGHDHLLSLEPAVGGGNDVALAVRREAVDAHAGAYRQVEPCRVGLEVVGHLVLGGKRPRRRGEGPAR